MNTVKVRGLPDGIRNILRIYAAKWKINISASDYESLDGRLAKPNMLKNTLEVWFGVSPSVGAFSGGSEDSLGEAFRMDLSFSQSTGVTASLIGFPIRDDSETVVAEVVGNSLYVLFDLSDYDTYSSSEVEVTLTVLKRILDAYEKLPLLEKRTELEGRRSKYLRSNSFRNFQTFFEDSDHSAQQIKDQYEYLLRISKGDLVINEKEIRFTLHKVQYRPTGSMSRRRKVGDLLVILRPEDYDEADGVEIFYLDPDYEGSHDHIGGNGELCLGNIDGGVSEFLRQNELARAAESVKIFCQES